MLNGLANRTNQKRPKTDRENWKFIPK